MKEIHLKRLERLAKEHEIRAKRGERLSMEIYAFDCKTPACSLGHACFIPEFRKAGLRLNQNFKPVYRGESQTRLATFFGLKDMSDDVHLFGVDQRSHAQQARILRAFIAKQRKAMKQKQSA